MSKACHCCEGTGEETDNAKIGRSLSGLRLRAGIPLRRFARLMGVSHSYLCQLEKGDRTWSADLRAAYHFTLKQREAHD